MVRDCESRSRDWCTLNPEAEALLTPRRGPSCLRACKNRASPASLQDNDELGVMLPYTPLHHLLFAAGAPEILVMTSANRSSEPIAYEDADALQRLAGIADAFLIGERPIARRMDDSVARAGAFGPRFCAARAVTPGRGRALPVSARFWRLGADLKNTITLVVERPGIRQPAHRRPRCIINAFWRLPARPSTISVDV